LSEKPKLDNVDGWGMRMISCSTHTEHYTEWHKNLYRQGMPEEDNEGMKVNIQKQPFTKENSSHYFKHGITCSFKYWKKQPTKNRK